MQSVDRDQYLLAWRAIMAKITKNMSDLRNVESIREGLVDISETYRYEKECSIDNWMTQKKVADSIAIIRRSIHRAKQEIRHPQIQAHLNANAPEPNSCEYLDCLTNIASAAKWAEFNLVQDFARLQQKGKQSQRRTRVSVRDKYLIPSLSKLLYQETSLRPTEEKDELEKFEDTVRLILGHWALLTGIEGASTYGRIAKKRLRALILSTVKDISETE